MIRFLLTKAVLRILIYSIKMNILLRITISICLLTSCTKFGKNVYVDGRVYNPITGEGIPNIPIRLYRNTIDSKDPLGVGSKTLETTTTDANGYYKVEHLSTPFNKVWIRLNSLDYYPIGWVDFGNQGEAGIKKGKKNHLDYQMVPYGDLILDIHNVNCTGVSDTMVFRKKWLGLTEFEGSYSTPRIGCYSYTSPFAFKVPMGMYVYEMKVTRSGVITYAYDTVVVPKTGIVTINMEY